MITPMQGYIADHRYLLDVIRQQVGLADPVSINLGELELPLLEHATPGEFVPVGGVLVRDWNPKNHRRESGTSLGMRVYQIEGIRFVHVDFLYHPQRNCTGLYFTAVAAADYRCLYRIALRCHRELEKPRTLPPVLNAEQRQSLWQNTIGFLETANLQRYQAYGARAKRGVLLMGAPGNGKTMACRWIMQECQQRGWEWNQVTPDAYRQARQNNCVDDLFCVDKRGVIFFDDMDLALRDRETVHESDDQAVFLGALDGITVNEGVVFVFTSNCAPELIDRAFKRPGRLDLVLHFEPPGAELRQQLIQRWHADIRRHLDVAKVVSSTNGCSFAEIEELKTLLVMQHLHGGVWDWNAAMEQFAINRRELKTEPQRRVGFQPIDSRLPIY